MTKNKFQTIKIKAKPSGKNKIPNTGDITLKLSGGQSLGMVQGFQLNASVESFPKLVIDTILSEAELEILQSQTELKVTIQKNSKENIYYTKTKNHEINI